MKSISIFIIIFFCATLFNCKAQKDDIVTEITPEELNVILKEQNGIRMLDVRTPKEFKISHISGAENINFLSDNFSKSLEVLNREEPLIIYCKSGRRSGKSIAVFKKLGFLKVYELEGGILNWKANGFDTELK
ncbi:MULTISPECIES: rhodanese-like domain-containing protein [unclassified Algibacter]|uniref:rhodanese-like domain-containing protein n=1 Tax=unclassified Algibacter TaxID=2615009 RepID=UPI00131EC7A7|nr:MULTISPECIES: rhodanese-like domain-containing protein [unclassified Algibacter]MCL5130457.1 rhodanese-like domain-containing protein [Algibacter sp. L4_22]